MCFQYNEILVISDGTEALMGSLSADSERFMPGVPLTVWNLTASASLTNWKP